MPRGRLLKIDILARVLNKKKELGEGRYDDQSYEWREGYNNALNQVLDDLNEYSN